MAFQCPLSLAPTPGLTSGARVSLAWRNRSPLTHISSRTQQDKEHLSHCDISKPGLGVYTSAFGFKFGGRGLERIWILCLCLIGIEGHGLIECMCAAINTKAKAKKTKLKPKCRQNPLC